MRQRFLVQGFGPPVVADVKLSVAALDQHFGEAAPSGSLSRIGLQHDAQLLFGRIPLAPLPVNFGQPKVGLGVGRHHLEDALQLVAPSDDLIVGEQCVGQFETQVGVVGVGFNGAAIVCDGFVGNVVLKFYESAGRVFVAFIKRDAPDILKRPDMGNVLKILDWATYGGAPLLGVQGVSIICHGSSPARAFANAIRVALQAVESHLSRDIEAEFARGEDVA